MKGRSPIHVTLSIWIVLSAIAGTATPIAGAADGPVTVTNYTDPSQALNWGQRSHWKQPWRSYLDTVPAATLLNAVGINFNVSPRWASSTARLLANNGFRRARLEIGWGTIDYDDPSQMTGHDRENLEMNVTALRESGIRPLIVLNANHTMPCPKKEDVVELTEPASAGDTMIHVDPSEVSRLIMGRSGITIGPVAAEVLFTSIDPNGSAHLSKPLPRDLPAGPLKVATLLYEPFRSPTLEDGSPNPRFEATMQGWLSYVGVVTREVKSVLGTDDFDVEIWNELSFGSRFLNINNYYLPPLEGIHKPKTDQAIVRRTIDYLRSPAHGVEGVGIGNGFANQRPWDNGTEAPLGLTAIDKHPYAGWESFPSQAQVNGNQPLNGLGEPAGHRDSPSAPFYEDFTPTYESFFPERFLSGIHTETLVHDLSPYPSLVAKVEHGRYTHPDGGKPLEMWITEVNLGPGSGPTPRTEMTAEDLRHIATKNILRYLSAYVNKGVTAIDFYAANAGDLSLVDQTFFHAVKSNFTVYPGDEKGGETIDAVSRFTATMRGAEPIASPRDLRLRELTDYAGNVQFEGNGTPAYPPLYNRDVFGFFPFQVSSRRFVIPVYVMTRNVAEAKRPDTTGPARFDLPSERYRMVIGGVDGDHAVIEATDPLTGEAVPVDIVARSGATIAIEMGVTDSPRLLVIEEGGGAPPSEDEGDKPSREADPLPPNGGPASAAPPPAIESLTPTIPRLELRGGGSLLTKRRMRVVAHCNSHCTLRVTGRLTIGRRAYPMHRQPRGARTSADQGKPSIVELAISARFASRARVALRRGSSVRAVVTAAVRSDSGASGKLRRVVTLRR